MWGTIARLKVRPGVSEEYLLAQMRALNAGRVAGWVNSAFYRSDEDPREYWLVAMFEDKESYRANAESAATHSVYLTFRSCLEDDPEWHDVGEIISFRADANDQEAEGRYRAKLFLNQVLAKKEILKA